MKPTIVLITLCLTGCVVKVVRPPMDWPNYHWVRAQYCLTNNYCQDTPHWVCVKGLDTNHTVDDRLCGKRP